MKQLKLKLQLAGHFLGRSSSGRFASTVAFISTLGIGIGICALIVVTAIMSGLEDQLKLVILGSTPQVIVYNPDEEFTEKLNELNTLRFIAPMVQGRVILQSKSGAVPAQIDGLDPDNAIYYQERVRLRVSVPTQGSYELTLSAALFETLNVGIGDKIRVISTQNARMTPLGLTPSSRLFSITNFIRQANQADGNRAVGHYEDVKRLLRLSDDDKAYRLYLDDPYDLDEVVAFMQKNGYEYETWQDRVGDFFAAVNMEKHSMGLMLFLIVMVATFNLLSSLTMMVSSRLEEIAILKTLGMKERDILEIFFIMGLLCSLTGIVLGVILGIIVSLNANELMALLNISISSSAIPIVLNPNTIAAIAAVCLALSFVCTAYPAFKAAGVDAAQNLEHK